MNCKKCGNQLEEKWQYCPQCNASVNSKIVENKQEENQKLLENSNSTELIYVIVFLVNIALAFTIRSISGIAFIIALITIVTGKIKCPKSKTINALFWVFLIGIVVFMIYMVVMLIMCANFLNTVRCP